MFFFKNFFKFNSNQGLLRFFGRIEKVLNVRERRKPLCVTQYFIEDISNFIELIAYEMVEVVEVVEVVVVTKLYMEVN